MKRLHNWLLDLNDAVFLQIVITWYLVGIGVAVALVEVILTRNVSGLGLNLSTEMIGGALTYVLLSVIVGRQLSQEAEKRAVEQEKRRLILQMGSPDNAFAVEAARILRARGWGFKDDTTLQGARLYDANLKRADLAFANLKGADLEDANFQEAVLFESNLERVYMPDANLQEAELSIANLKGVYLEDSNLREAKLSAANLQEAKLIGADLQGVQLCGANLGGANLEGANLQGADLSRTNLLGANLKGANLQRVVFEDAKFDKTTVLPDISEWTPDTDMTRFTDPGHPDFWRSGDPRSPAWGYKDYD